jgi:hypothetical protein
MSARSWPRTGFASGTARSSLYRSVSGLRSRSSTLRGANFHSGPWPTATTACFPAMRVLGDRRANASVNRLRVRPARFICGPGRCRAPARSWSRLSWSPAPSRWPWVPSPSAIWPRNRSRGARGGRRGSFCRTPTERNGPSASRSKSTGASPPTRNPCRRAHPSNFATDHRRRRLPRLGPSPKRAVESDPRRDRGVRFGAPGR